MSDQDATDIVIRSAFVANGFAVVRTKPFKTVSDTDKKPMLADKFISHITDHGDSIEGQGTIVKRDGTTGIRRLTVLENPKVVEDAMHDLVTDYLQHHPEDGDR